MECALSLVAQVIKTLDMNPKVGGSSPPQAEAFSVSKASTFSQEHLFVNKKESSFLRTINISNVHFSAKTSIPQELLFKNMEQQMFGPASSSG